MLERMDQFFETRLSGYDENMLNSIEGAGEFYKFTAAQLPRGIVATGMSGGAMKKLYEDTMVLAPENC